jgi:hypothetical protein
LNGGGEVLKIRTVAGNIEIRKINAQSLDDLQRREAGTWKAWEERRTEKERRRRDKEQQQRQRDRNEDNDDE